jgi:hypothetical protein
MITRIEIDGFKSFVDFELDVPPFLVIVGSNNGGKSNLLEAVDIWRSIMMLGNSSALVAGKRGRGSQLFHRDSQGNIAELMKIAVRWKVGSAGDQSAATEVMLPQFDVRRTFNDRDLTDDDTPPAIAAETVTWKHLEFQPELMRQPAVSQARPFLDPRGSDFAAVVNDMYERRNESDEYGRFLMDAVSIVPGLAQIEPVFDERRDELDLDFVFDSGRRLPSTLVSDGTLRIVGLLSALHFDGRPKTILIDEVEVGLHPAFLLKLVERIQRRVAENPKLQIMVTSHSPVVVSGVLAQNPDSVVFLDQVTSAYKFSPWQIAPTSFTRARRVAESGQRGTYVTPREVRRYLDTVRIAETV